jgi:phosphinothricin acetyltransferase
MLVRPSAVADQLSISGIYAHYVRNSTATFELDPPDPLEMAARRSAILDHGLPFLVAEDDGEVVGYAYASTYRARPAYRYTVEDSVYVHPVHARRGAGRLLLQGVIHECERAGFRQMIGVIGDSGNLASIRLHLALGFRQAGTLRSVGYKFDRWIDTVLVQKELGAGSAASPR